MTAPTDHGTSSTDGTLGHSWPAEHVTVQGSREWFEMLGTLMVEAAGLVPLPDRVTFLERYRDGTDLGESRVQGICFDVADGRATYRVGVRPDDRADIEVSVTREAARSLNLMLSTDAGHDAARARYAESGELTLVGDSSPLAALLALLHDPVVRRTT